ncbi:MAG: B12-binding domain-containing radical SAM protein [Gammaproteobacteria bacterium RIFCSPLOWO2_02_FULL_61_13]|nr:MAG: B12-binding domain-containing radical SAM protein [Gammaproteobacteria bacterium RIFCSPLOWO2_02_FULL_61_13]
MRTIDQTSASRQKVDVLFINPGSLQAVYQNLAGEFSAVEPPSLAALFADYLRRKDLSVDLIDVPAYGLDPAQAAQLALAKFDPTLIVLVVYGYQPSASTQTMPAAGATCRELKARRPDVPILMTGTHPAALPRRTLEEEAVDFVCGGEGPDTILGVAREMRSGKQRWDTVPNLWYRDGDSVRNTAPAPLLEALDAEMPSPAWDLLPMDRYRAHNWHCFENIEARQPYASIHTTLGCPYRCTFCCINAPFGKPSYRMWSPDTVVAQIDELVGSHGVRNIKIVDEMFVLNRQHVLGICERLIERNYGLNIWAYARVDTVKDEYLEKLARAGFRWLALGIESASKHVRDGVEKGRFGSAEIIDVVHRIQGAGINVIGNYIFGLPDDTFETMEETLALALHANCEFANFYSAMAYPGSALYRLALEKGWALPETWLGYSQHSYETLPLRTEKLPAAEVLRFRDQAFHRYFSDSGYLGSVREKFGAPVVAHLQRMTQIRLERRICQ